MKHSLEQGLFVVQGIEIDLLSDERLSSFISYYFHILFQGENGLDTQPLKFKLYVTEESPPVPHNAVKVIRGPSVTYYYSDNKKIHFVSNDGSSICLDPMTMKAHGFLKKDILKKSMELFPLIGSPIAEILKYHGLFLWHAAALYGNGISFLVSGDGGCGKTTTSLSLVQEGFRYVSDDSLFLQEINDEISVSPLYKNFHIDRDLADRFPGVLGDMNPEIPEGTKVSADISRLFPGSFIPSLRPDIIIFPKIVSHKKSTLHPLSRMEIYGRLLKQTILAVDKDISRRQLKILEMLVKQTRGFELLSGRDIYENPKKLIRLISRIISVCV